METEPPDLPGPSTDRSEPASRPRARPDVVFRRVGGDWLLFDPRAGRIHVLNLTAALVWSFCTGESTPQEIADEVGAAFGGEPAMGPVAEALERFRVEGLLT